MQTSVDQFPQTDDLSEEERRRYIGNVARVAGGLLVPEASSDIHEAGYRFDAKEWYSEPPVEIGEMHASERLLEVFEDKPYVTYIFTLDVQSGEIIYSQDEMDAMHHGHEDMLLPRSDIGEVAELLAPTIKDIMRDYEQFRGEAVSSHSLVDEVDEIDFGDTRVKVDAQFATPKVRIELRGGIYESTSFGEPQGFFYHTDGSASGNGVAYLCSLYGEGVDQLDTHMAVGVLPEHEELRKELGTVPHNEVIVHTEPGHVYRVSSLRETEHSAPPDNSTGQTRVFLRVTIT